MSNKQRIQKIIRWSLGILSGWFLAHVLYLVYDGTQKPATQADFAVILGSTVFPDGQLSPKLQKRLDCGLQLYEDKKVGKMLVSGGFGKEGQWEGEKMREYLESKGVDSTDIFTDNHGDNTLMTAIHSKKIADSLHYQSVIVVSQYFHITRTKMLFRKIGFEKVSGASPNYTEWRDMYSIAREFIGFYWYLYLKRDKFPAKYTI